MSKCTIKKVKRNWTTWNGTRMFFDGYDVTVPTPMGSTTKSVETIQEAFGIVGKYDNEADAIEKRGEEISEFITNNPEWN